MGSPLHLGVTRGALQTLIPCYPPCSQAPRPTSQAAHCCETSSKPMPPAVDGRRPTNLSQPTALHQESTRGRRADATSDICLTPTLGSAPTAND
jgi:hypothetical protein